MYEHLKNQVKIYVHTEMTMNLYLSGTSKTESTRRFSSIVRKLRIVMTRPTIIMKDHKT